MTEKKKGSVFVFHFPKKKSHSIYYLWNCIKKINVQYILWMVERKKSWIRSWQRIGNLKIQTSIGFRLQNDDDNNNDDDKLNGQEEKKQPKM